MRKRREEELERRMRALGFVEAPSPRDERPGHARSASVDDAERDVVFLVDADIEEEGEEGCRDEEEEREPAPMRSESRAAMRKLFTASACAPKPEPDYSTPRSSYETIGGRPEIALDVEAHVDVEVELVTKEAVARTRRRFSRKWVREQGGKRWTEKDFSEIISELRKLR